MSLRRPPAPKRATLASSSSAERQSMMMMRFPDYDNDGVEITGVSRADDPVASYDLTAPDDEHIEPVWTPPPLRHDDPNYVHPLRRQAEEQRVRRYTRPDNWEENHGYQRGEYPFRLPYDRPPLWEALPSRAPFTPQPNVYLPQAHRIMYDAARQDPAGRRLHAAMANHGEPLEVQERPPPLSLPSAPYVAHRASVERSLLYR